MNTVLQNIWILVIVQIVRFISCQESYNGDILRYQQLAPNDGQVEAITSYSSNIVQRDPSGQSVSSVTVQYQMTEDSNKKEEHNSSDRPRRRKIYRIKNPFQNEQENIEQNADKYESQDSGTSASNQYSAIQYSLPPQEFLQQMRTENQLYHQQLQQQQQHQQQQQQQLQQQQLQQQFSTPAPTLSFTVTPQSQYQYSTVSPLNYDHNIQHQHIQSDTKPVQPMLYHSNLNFPFSASNYFKLDNVRSTPSPVTSYVSTASPINQYVVTPTTPYVSSSSPLFLSTQPNSQQYMSSSILPIQSSSDYSNRFTSTVGSNSINYDTGDASKRMQIDHYDNSVNGMRYPSNAQQQYQNEYPSSTPIPSSSPYSAREAWQNSFNAGINALTRSLQEASLSQYQTSYNGKQQELPIETNADANTDTHRMGDFPSANNLYYNYVQPDYRTLQNMNNNPVESEKDRGQRELFSNGDYGWKLTDKKPSVNQNSGYVSNNFVRQSVGADGGAVSQVSFHMDTSKPYNYDQNSKSLDSKNSQDFAKAAAKAQENLKQQQIYNSNYNTNFNDYNSQIKNINDFHNNDNQKNKYDSSNSNSYSYTHTDLITASPIYYGNTRETSTPDNRPKQPFDHAKALKTIVPMDASNVVQNSELQSKSISGYENTNHYKTSDYNKDQNENSSKQLFKSVTDSFYKDKNSIYGFNVQTKPEDFVTIDTNKNLDSNYSPYFKKPQSQESSFNFAGFSGPTNTVNYVPQISSGVSDNLQFTNNFQRPQNQIPTDILSILKLNDVPYKLTQGLSTDALRLHNNNFDQSGMSTPLPLRLNQNLGSHQLDITSSLLNKLINNKQQIDSLSTINGFKIANPYNVDLNLVAEMLKGKSNVDDSHISLPKDQFSNPLNLDLSQLQYLLRNENSASLGSPFLDIYNSGRFPYQGVKYSRSQEEEESLIPIADTSNSHPIGAVVEEETSDHEITSGSDLTAQDDETVSTSFGEDIPKKVMPEQSEIKIERPRHPNAITSGRFRKYPKTIKEPSPLLKPPPPMSYRNRVNTFNSDRFKRRRRPMKSKMVRVLKAEPLFKADSELETSDIAIPVLLKPPSVNSAKSDE